MKKIISLVLVLVMLLALASCGPKSGGNQTNDGQANDGSQTNGTQGNGNQGGSPDSSGGTDTITIAVTNDAGTLSPAFSTSTTFAVVCSMMETLWDVDQNGDVKMLLCESIDKISDTEMTVHLRKDVKFHNGNPLTADDVLFSMNIHKDAGASGAPRVQTVDFEKTNVVDDHTLDLHLVAPTVANWTVLSQCVIYDKESYDEANAAISPIGTGPYKFVSYVPNSEIKMERNEDYWGELPEFKYVNCKILAEDSQRMNALETGLIDLAMISTDDHEYATSLDNLDIISYYSGNYLQMNFNFGHNSVLYQNTEARQAIAHAIDTNAILQTVFLGLGKPMHACIVDYCFDFEDRFNDLSDIYKIGYNVEVAKQLADSSGLTGQTVDIMTDGSTRNIRIAEMIVNMLSQIGVNGKIVNYDAATAWQLSYDIDSDWDISIGTGISPNRRCGDLLLNGVRYSNAMTAPGAFADNDVYLQKAPDCMSLQDEKALSDALYEMIKWYEDEVLSFSLFDVEMFYGVSKNIDPDSITLSVGSSGVRLGELKSR